MTPTTRITVWLRLTRPRPAAARRRPTDRRRTAAAAVVVGLITLVSLQLGLGVTAERVLLLKDPGYADKERRLARAEAAHPGTPTVVMLGTSRTGFGFHAARVRDRLAAAGTPVVAFNFGIPASGPVTHLVYLRRLLADGHRPTLLLVEVLPPTLADLPDGPLEARFLHADRLRHAEAEAVVGYDFPADRTRATWLRSVLLPWHQLRFPLLGRLAPSALPWHLRFDWSRTPDELGWSTPPMPTVTPAEYAAGLDRAAGEYRAILHDLRPTGGGARALADLLALCRAEGIPARLVLMPESVGFRALTPPAADGRLDAVLQQLTMQYGCSLIDARDWLPDAAFTDGHHMLRPGAEAFSDRLTDAVVRPSFGGR